MFRLDGSIELTVLTKAVPETGRKHGEAVCVAGIDEYGNWHRLYPVPFRDLSSEQQFKRWDRIAVNFMNPPADDRIESKRIDHQSLRIIENVPLSERARLAHRAVAISLEEKMSAGRTLALIEPINQRFIIRWLTEREREKSQRRRDEFLSQSEMFGSPVLPRDAPPYAFHYRFEHSGRMRDHVCIDWETEHTFIKWRGMYGEESALTKMQYRWGRRCSDPACCSRWARTWSRFSRVGCCQVCCACPAQLSVNWHFKGGF